MRVVPIALEVLTVTVNALGEARLIAGKFP
jgi:hypothetical protein